MSLALPGTGPITLPTDTTLAASPTPADLATKKLATMELFAADKSANGYQKLPSGLIIQWVTIASGGAADGTVALPISFPTACLTAWANTSTVGVICHAITAFTASQLSYARRANASGSATNDTSAGRAFAIGY